MLVKDLLYHKESLRVKASRDSVKVGTTLGPGTLGRKSTPVETFVDVGGEIFCSDHRIDTAETIARRRGCLLHSTVEKTELGDRRPVRARDRPVEAGEGLGTL